MPCRGTLILILILIIFFILSTTTGVSAKPRRKLKQPVPVATSLPTPGRARHCIPGSLIELEAALSSYNTAPDTTIACMEWMWKQMDMPPEWGLLFARLVWDAGRSLDAISLIERDILPSLPRSKSADAHYILGLIHRRSEGGCQAALPHFEEALAIGVAAADPFFHCAFCLKAAGRIEEAINVYQKCVDIKPVMMPCAQNLGRTLHAVGRHEEAVKAFEIGLADGGVKADTEFYNDYGLALLALNAYSRAIEVFNAVLDASPANLNALTNLANTYIGMGNEYREQAVKVYERGLVHHNNSATLHYNLGRCLKSMGRMERAVASFRAAIDLTPTGDFPEALASLFHSLYSLCAWDEADRLWPQMERLIEAEIEAEAEPAGAFTPFQAMTVSVSAQTMLAVAKSHADALQRRIERTGAIAWDSHSQPQLGHQLRVGYISSDLGAHPLSYLLRSVFGMHDGSNVDVHVFSTRGDDGSDEFRHIMTAVGSRFYFVAQMSDKDTARLIAEQQLHVLVDLNGWTKGHRFPVLIHLQSSDECPVIVSFMGFCGSTGSSWTDHILTDRVASPPRLSADYSESMMYMPTGWSYFVNDYNQSWTDVPVEAEMRVEAVDHRIASSDFVFCNFNQLYKIHRDTFKAWLRILERVSGSVIWLLRFPEGAVANLLREAGLKYESRFVFSEPLSHREHLNRIRRCHLFLDSPDVNAHTGAVDVLWAGVPILTMPRRKMASRVAASAIAASGHFGHESLIVSSFDEYVDQAVRLAMAKIGGNSYAISGENEYYSIRSSVMSRSSGSIFDTQGWVKRAERGYRVAFEAKRMGRSRKMHVVIGFC